MDAAVRRGGVLIARARTGPLAGRIPTTVFAEVDLEPTIVLTTSNGLDGLDGVGDVGEVHKGATLLAQGVDELDLAMVGEILAQPILRPGLVQVAHVDVP